MTTLLTRTELPVDTVGLARYLIGKVLVRETADRGVLSGRIVETEAYPVGDAAGHAYRGETARNHALFLCRGHAYVYLAYGVSYMLNVSSEVAGVGAGVLFRALEPMEGIAAMQRNRGVEALRDLARGPGGWRRRSTSTCVSTASTFARQGRCGWRGTATKRPISEPAPESGFRARLSGPCGSICGAAALLAVPGA